MNEIRTQRVKLKILDEADAEKLLLLRSNPQVNQFIKRKNCSDIAEIKAWIKKINNDASKLFFTIHLVETNELMGTIALKRIDCELQYAEVGYELFPEYHSKGIMSEALKAVLNFCSKDLGLKTIEAYTNYQNVRSRKLLEKNQFILQNGRTDSGNLENVIYRLTI